MVKRFPRLSETFIINEIRGLEYHHLHLAVYSLLPPEPGRIHTMVKDVRAPVDYPPAFSLVRQAGLHLTALKSRPLGYLRALAAVLKRFWRRPGWRNWHRAVQLTDWVQQRHIDRVHAHFAHGPASVAYFLHLLTGLPYSISGHAKDLYLSDPRALVRRLRRAVFMVTCTAANRAYLTGLAPEMTDKIVLCRHGIDVAQFTRAGPASSDDPLPILLSVGRLVEKKGYDHLLAAYDLLAAQGIAFRAVIVGSGPLALVLRRDLENRGLSGYVRLLGAMTHEQLVPLYHAARLFTLAPRVLGSGDRDGLPNVLLEAMAARLPIVTTSVSGIPEILVDGRHALLVPPEDPQALAEVLRYALANPTFMQGLAEESFALAATAFDFRQAVRPLARLLGSDTGSPAVSPIREGAS